MADHLDIQKVIDLFDQRIKRLQEARELLVEEFGEAKRGGLPVPVPRQRRSGAQNRNGNEGSSERKQQLEKFLRTHGPTRRSDLSSGSGVPDGTVGYLLSKYHDTFVRRSDKKWTLTERQAAQVG
jgi:hypothetical protein